MTGNLVLDLLVSVTGVALVVALVRLAFAPAPLPLTTQGTIDYLALEEPDFVPGQTPDHWLCDKQGRAYLIADVPFSDFIIIRPTADHYVHRRVAPKQFHTAMHQDGYVTVDLGDPTFAAVTIESDGAMQWGKRGSARF